MRQSKQATMQGEPQSETVVELPDGTVCTVTVRDNAIQYVVNPPGEGRVTQHNEYDAEDARRQAAEIRQREATSWDTVFPEEAGPVLDVATALEQAANSLDG